VLNLFLNNNSIKLMPLKFMAIAYGIGLLSSVQTLFMSRKEKNNHESDAYENTGRKRLLDSEDKDESYVDDDDLNTTDSDAAEIDPRIRQASQSTGNNIEEGDEDYDDEEEEKKLS
jgi:hypothetical protein